MAMATKLLITRRKFCPNTQTPEIVVDTSDWVDYYNEKYSLAFKHDPDWKVRSLTNRDGYYVIEIDPGVNMTTLGSIFRG